MDVPAKMASKYFSSTPSQGGAEKQKRQKSSKSTSRSQTCDLKKPCTKHTKNVIKFYCHDHNALICSVCVTLEHTTTFCHVEYIPDISGLSLDSFEFRETLKDIDKLTNKCSQITSGLKQRVAKSTTSLRDAIAEIENFRKEINKRLDKLEKEVKDTATTIQQKNRKMLKTKETTCDDIKKSLQASTDTLKHLNSQKKTNQLFAELKKAQQLIQEKSKILSQLPTLNDFDNYIFQPNQTIKKFFQDEKSLGTLSSKKLKQPFEPKKQIEAEMKMSTPRSFNIKTSLDTEDCWITGVAVSPQNIIFAADTNNNSVKMINIKSGAIKQIQFESEPWDVTIVNNDTLAVTLPGIDSSTIQFISFSPDSLSLKKTLKTYGMCHGISHNQGKLAVTRLKPPELHIMALESNFEIIVNTDSKGENMFRYPWHVTSNKHSIHVSDNPNDAVLEFNWQGEMIGLILFNNPCGLTLLDDGSLLLNDYDGQGIYIVSDDYEDGKKILEDLDNLHKLQSICWCAQNRTLCVGRENDDIILYKMM